MTKQCNYGLDTYTVSFFGHRILEASLLMEKHIEALISKLLREKAYVEFLVGRDGDFDQIVSSVIRRCKRNIRDDNSAHVWVQPYPIAMFRDNEGAFRQYYDEIEVCGTAATSHFKGAHQARNRAMVDRSDLVIFCVQHQHGGAWQTMQYAKRRAVPYVNIWQFPENNK